MLLSGLVSSLFPSRTTTASRGLAQLPPTFVPRAAATPPATPIATAEFSVFRLLINKHYFAPTYPNSP